MNIKVNQKKLLSVAPLFAVTVVLLSFFIWQLRLSTTLKQKFDSKSKEFKQTEAASKHLRGLEKQISDIKQKEEMQYKRVPINEKEPLSLMRTLIRLGGQAGLKGISLSLKEKTAPSQSAAYQGSQVATQDTEGGSEEAPAQQAAVSSEASVTESPVSSQTGALSPIYLEMDFEGSFPQVVAFLEKLAKLERIVKVDGVRIERKKEILPYQKVSLDLITYTFIR